MAERRYSEVQSVERAARVLLAFVKADSWGPTELAHHTGLHKSVVHRLLLTLAGSGLLQRDGESGQYSLGLVMAQLNPRGGANGALKRIARPFLQRLAAACGETIGLCVLEDNHGLCIDYIDSPQAMRFTVFEGERFPLNAGCIGKVILAFQPDAFVESLIAQKALKRYTKNTITDPGKLRAELLRIRRLGHAFSDSEMTPRSRSVGAPIHGPDGQVIAGLTISAPDFRMPNSKVDDFIAMVRDEAERLSYELGYPGNAAGTTTKEAKEKPDAL
ncbi:IclR family transcriptional regulator [Vineibacter terrae]|uniref:IclR family transcriptional regulator n=1 Tax=Vineibacter terrae TaxID=2586908 RepID=A0A5C8PN93_9HYPH|nr:IclR family transcriptional regulator [Vineibacter terrae]TXL76038.1 IclR family transcriptional regulator [Vineibacter terrae]